MNIYMFCLDSFGANPLRSPEKCPKLTKWISKSSLLYKNVIVSTPYTYGSIASMFTGLYGTVNGVDNWQNAEASFKSDELITLPQILKNVGYKSFFVGYTSWKFIPLLFDKAFLIEQVQDMQSVGEHRVGSADIKLRKNHHKKSADIINKTLGNKFVFVANMNYHDINRLCDLDIPQAHWCDPRSEYYNKGMKIMDDSLWIDFFDIDLDKDIVILFSDHGGGIWSDVYLNENFVKCFWAIATPKRSSKKIDKFYSSVDFLSVILNIIGLTDKDVCQGKRDGSDYCVSFGGIANPKFTKFISPYKPNQFMITNGEYFYYKHDCIGEMITKDWNAILEIHNKKSNIVNKDLIDFFKMKMDQLLHPDKSISEFYHNLSFMR